MLGAIVLGHQRTNFFTAEDRTIAQAAADVCATAIKNVQLSEELRRVVNLDPFTGAYNQRYLHTALEQEIFRSRRHGKHIGLVMLDLHNLRTINNQIGLEAGDSLLRSVAQALRSNVRHNDLVCRYVADRFCVLLPELNSDGLTVVLGKLQDAVHGIEVPYREKPLPLTATWAAVEYPTDRDTAIELMKLLTSRLDEAKSQAAQSGG
ncbi:MAG: GGDEF domain-containing protein [Acidobacteria bacterium]|nr:GGDEF domain-containing protein [Acidobacteriota bacterium]